MYFSYNMSFESKPCTLSGAKPKKQQPAPMFWKKSYVELLGNTLAPNVLPYEGFFKHHFDLKQ